MASTSETGHASSRNFLILPLGILRFIDGTATKKQGRLSQLKAGLNGVMWRPTI